MTETTSRLDSAPGGGTPPHGLTPLTDDEAAERRKGMLRLMVIVVVLVAGSLYYGVLKTVGVIFAVILMIMLHELGHFATAKWAGMKVTEYFLGFGPRIWSVRKGETEYGIKAIPAGGYVKIIGMNSLEEVDPADEHRTYRQQPYWQRLVVVCAGSTVHFILAFLLLVGVVGIVGVDTGTGFGMALRPDAAKPVISEVSMLKSGPSPAVEAGFQVGDRILEVDGTPVTSWEQVPSHVRPRAGQRVTFLVERDGARRTLTATPMDRTQLPEVKKAIAKLPPSERPTGSIGFIGLSPTFPVDKERGLSAFGQAADDFGTLSSETLKSLGGVVSFSGVSDYGKRLMGKEVPTDAPRFLSPVGLVQVAGETGRSGLSDVLILLVLINIFVGFFNMLPLPPLDGGHAAIATYEAIKSKITGRRQMVDMYKVMPLTYAVFLLIVFLGLTSLYLDITQPILGN